MTSLFDQVVKVLAPGLGESMARSSVEMHLKKAGLARESFGPQHVPALVKALQPGLAVFVGQATAAAMADRLMALDNGSGKG